MKKQYKMSDLLEALGGDLLFGTGEERSTGVSSDTRQIEAGNLFVALRGERFDAHRFLDQAVAKGASVLCVSDLEQAKRLAPGACLWLVKDTFQAFKALAAYYRQHLSGKIIAVSGSVGKTSTRDMVFAALSSLHASKTEANLNNEIGVAQTLFATDEEAEALVIELGIGESGEMARLSDMVKPDIAMITMIGHSHIEYFGSQAALTQEKLVLANKLREGGLLILNADDSSLMEAAKGEDLLRRLHSKKQKLAFIGIETERLPEHLSDWPLLQAKELRFEADQSYFVSSWKGEHSELLNKSIPDGTAFSLNSYGRHMVQNALFAMLTAAFLGLSAREVQEGLLRYQSTGARQKKREGNSFTLIDDSYNASPEAMRAALAYLKELGRNGSGRTIAALGCVNELGHESLRLHREIGRDIGRTRPDLAYLCGPWAEDMAEACRLEQMGTSGTLTELHCFPDRESLSGALLPVLRPHDILLVKASHSFAMDKLGEEAWRVMEEDV